MSVRFYMDVHIPRAVTVALRLRGIDVLTAQQDGMGQAEDDALLLRATSLGRILVTQDEDLLRESARFLQTDIPFSGVVYGHQMLVGIGRFVEDLTLIAVGSSPEEWSGRVCFLPL